MRKMYWIGLALLFIGIALYSAPTGDYRALAFLAGVVVQAAGTICIFLEIYRIRRTKGVTFGRKAYICLAIGIVVFIIGILLGFFLVHK